MSVRRLRALVGGLAALATLASCGGSDAGGSGSSITVYTCVNDTTIQPVIDHFEHDHPGASVSLYRAPTGDLNARIAGDVRSGGMRADVVWACDPLTMQGYVDQGLVGGWVPHTTIAARWRTGDYVGVALLYLVAVTGKDVPPPHSWADLAKPEYGGVVVPDPSFAASALGALGYFAQAKGYGLSFYQRLKAQGATQVSSPDDVVNDVAQGVASAGITVANSAYAAKDAGSPISVTWPSPGAIAVYGPVAIVKGSDHAVLAKQFISYVTSTAGQRVIADSGSYPTMAGVPGPTRPPDAAIVVPDWSAITAREDQLLSEYQQIFGG